MLGIKCSCAAARQSRAGMRAQQTLHSRLSGVQPLSSGGFFAGNEEIIISAFISFAKHHQREVSLSKRRMKSVEDVCVM